MPLLPQVSHSSERLQAYSDAVIAIIATVMAIPLATIEDDEVEKGDVLGILSEKSTQIIWFIVSFYVVCHWWSEHSVLWSTVHEVTHSAMLLNGLFLLSLSFYPIAYAFQDDYALDWRATTMYMSVLALTAIVFLCIRYITRPGIYSTEHEEMAWKLGLFSDINQAISALIGLCLIQVFRQISSSYSNLSFTVVIMKLYLDILHYARQVKKKPRLFVDPLHKKKKPLSRSNFLNCHSKSHIPRLRIEAFSDGVYAIAATFQFLEIHVPSPGDALLPSVASAFNEVKADVAAYLISFFAIGLLWVNHYSILHSMRTFSTVFSIINNLHLICVALLPFFFSILVNFWNTQTAVVATGLALVFTGATQFLLWYTGRKLKVRTALHSPARAACEFDEHDAHRKPFLLARILAIPISGACTSIIGAFTAEAHLFPLLLVPVVHIATSALESKRINALKLLVDPSESSSLLKATPDSANNGSLHGHGATSTSNENVAAPAEMQGLLIQESGWQKGSKKAKQKRPEGDADDDSMDDAVLVSSVSPITRTPSSPKKEKKEEKEEKKENEKKKEKKEEPSRR